MPECHSTNSVALDICHRESVPEGTVVVTNHQTAGRGQRGNTWESEPGTNLTFSLILRPTFLAVADQFLVSMITSLALNDYLKGEIHERTLIKWPNDILVNGFKIAGILIENQVAGQQFVNMVVGIGLNVNQARFSSSQATSMFNATGRKSDLEIVLHGVLKHLEVRYLQLRNADVNRIREDYLANLFRFNERHRLISNGKVFQGTIAGVDREGRLLVIADGNELSFDIKEVAFAD
jgi:BirA family biotin operon repressor/biotin-[acetyl-CoA-carboxylase] ligase